MEDIASILRLPALTTMRGEMLDIRSSPGSGPVAPSTLKKLHLSRSLVTVAGLDWVLACCPSLETLYVHWCSATVGLCEIEYHHLFAAINQRGKNLRALKLFQEKLFPWTLEDFAPAAYSR